MSWSDDEFDVEETLTKTPANQKNELDELYDSDEERQAEDEKRRAEAATVAAKAEAKNKEKAQVNWDVPLADAQAEKLRRKKLEEERDAKLAGDLFAGCDRPEDTEAKEKKAAEEAAKKEAEKKAAEKPKVKVIDAFDNVELNTQADVDALTGECVDKITNGKAKGASLKFLQDTIKTLEPELELKELDAMVKSIATLMKQKKVEATTMQQSARNKANNISKSTKISASDEMSVMYGNGDYEDWDEDWEEGDWYGKAK